MQTTCEQQKQFSLNLVETNNHTWIESMRGEGRRIARAKGRVCADDLRDYAETLLRNYGLQPKHPNAWGAIFRTDEFQMLDYCNSIHPSNHARLIRVYCLAQKH